MNKKYTSSKNCEESHYDLKLDITNHLMVIMHFIPLEESGSQKNKQPFRTNFPYVATWWKQPYSQKMYFVLKLQPILLVVMGSVTP